MVNRHQGPKAFMIAAPKSGSGKTCVTLGLLRALRNDAMKCGSLAPLSYKLGPDYIDPAFHHAASGEKCVNIDPWAMPYGLQCKLLTGPYRVVEAMMGLFDGAANGSASAAHFAAAHKMPIIFVVDCSGQSHSVAALLHGFSHFRKDVNIGGVVLNRVGSARSILHIIAGFIAAPIILGNLV